MDEYFENVTLLLPGNGTNGAQNNTFLDSSTNNFTITRNGNTTQGTFTPYGSNWSNYFGATGQYLSVAYSSAFNLTGDFTVECWINPGNLPSSIGPAAQSYERVFSFGTYNAANSLGLEINSNDSGNLRRFVSWYNGTSYGLGSNNAVAPGNWYHIAMVRSGTTITLYLNGTSIGTITGASAAVNTSQAFYIASLQGFEGDASAAFNGYISNFRIVKSAVYTSNFTPSASPLTAITNTVLLTCQDNRFRDNSTNNATVSVAGSPSVQRFSPFNPTAPYAAGTDGGSGHFDGSGDYLSLANPNTDIGSISGDFTIECWINWITAPPGNASGNERQIIGQHSWPESTSGNWWAILGVNVGVYAYFAGGGSYDLIGSSSFTWNVGSWYHVAVVRSGSTVTIYVNGIAVGSGTSTKTLCADNVRPLTIGADNDGSHNASNAYISNMRLVKGTAVYTSAFTPPTAPLTAITNTSLLLNFTNAGILDNAEMNNLETVGNAQISTAQSKFGGGSMLFDGSGDWLTAPNSKGLYIGSGDFTIEGWLYLNATGATKGIVSQFNSNGTGPGWTLYIKTTNVLEFYGGSGTVTVTGTAAIAATTWTHFAVVRSGSTITIYVNGTAGGTATNSSFSDDTSALVYVGGRADSASLALNGYIDDLRITKGYARYTSNFTAPTAPFPLY